MCQRVLRTVRALLLEEPYATRLALEVYGYMTAKGLAAQKAFDFGTDHHGLVVLDPEGQLLTRRPGHDYGAKEIRADFDRALAR